MPLYPNANMIDFRNRLRAVNGTVDRGLTAKVFGKSSLQPLLAILTNANGTASEVYRAIAALPQDKAQKYRDGLQYLLRTYPGMLVGGITLDDLLQQPIAQTRAAFYPMTPTPPNFDPDNRAGAALIQPPSRWTDGSIVQYLLANAATTNVLLVHLADAASAGMDEVFNGRSTRDYLTSAMRVARVMQCPTAALTVGPRGLPELYDDMRDEFRLLPVNLRQVFHDDTGHVCTDQAGLVTFLRSRPNCVVMGFDGTVCVVANVFGSGERVGGPGSAFKTPVLTFANVVMSRATLVTNGQLYAKTPTFGHAEYGPLALLGPN